MSSEQNIPQEASAGNRSLARNLRDMHVALVAEGFTERQATVMVSEVLKAAVTAKFNQGDA